MKPNEYAMIKEAIHAVFNWAWAREAHLAEVDLLPGKKGSRMTLQFVFPRLNLTGPEWQFFANESQAFSLNGTAPESFQMLERYTALLKAIDGQLLVTKFGNDGMIFSILIAVNDRDFSDAEKKVHLILQEIRGGMNARG